MDKTCPNSFQCGKEKGELGNTIALLEMENENLKAEILKLQQPLPPQFTNEEIWLKAWNSYTSSSNSTNKKYAKDWADECLKQYKIKFL